MIRNKIFAQSIVIFPQNINFKRKNRNVIIGKLGKKYQVNLMKSKTYQHHVHLQMIH